MNEDSEWLNKFLKICCSDDLRESSEQLNNAVQILKERYLNGFRHRYSQIAALLKTSPYNEYSSDQFDMLRQNMVFIESKFDELKFAQAQKDSSIKLFDHLNLEVDRINNIDRKIEQIQMQMQESQLEISQNLRIISDNNKDFTSLMEAVGRIIKENRIANDQLKDIKEQYYENNKRIGNATKELNDLEKRIDGFNTQSITILSIFTAIVFSFTGGFTMLGNALSNLDGINRNESIILISVILIIGCLLMDIVYFLLDFVGKLSKITFSGNCDMNCEVCPKKANGEITCKGWKKFKSRHFLIKCINIFTLIIVTLLLCANMLFVTPSYPEKKYTHNISNHEEEIITGVPSELSTQDVELKTKDTQTLTHNNDIPTNSAVANP